ncbi:acyl-CoA thioesterase [Anaeromyxobacter oryzisoli]|uniref:acyl-CoA thioesterase n=1 Tax=Anaeromyxobacter oryzisoli TaxID=2925408 RepID=UPI001F5758F9|nr:acyl-CoA thioesterase [Anaeromyxobacter sp. SG63]
MPDAKPASASHVEVTHLVMPSDANVHGTAFGGMVMQWTDLAAGMAAMRHSRLPVVTASIDRLSFLAPIRIGQMVILTAQVNAVFGTSMEVGVDVVTEDPLTGERRTCCDAFLTFIAIGPDGRPTRVPRLAVTTDEERRREEEAKARREARRAERGPGGCRERGSRATGTSTRFP